jgi:hypothetical protein
VDSDDVLAYLQGLRAALSVPAPERPGPPAPEHLSTTLSEAEAPA